MQSYFDTPPLVRFLQYIDWVDDDDLFDAFAREIMETGGSYIDPDAPIFEIADFGVVGDLGDVLPQAIAAIKEHRGA